VGWPSSGSGGVRRRDAVGRVPLVLLGGGAPVEIQNRYVHSQTLNNSQSLGGMTRSNLAHVMLNAKSKNKKGMYT
jgi:hypothetical protein